MCISKISGRGGVYLEEEYHVEEQELWWSDGEVAAAKERERRGRNKSSVETLST
jgi:hypothetical protein